MLCKFTKGINLLFECVRRELDWQNKFVERMRLYKEFYDNFVRMDSGFDTMPQLIFVCEDDKHMAEVFVEVVKNRLELDKIKLYFTTDLKQNSGALNKSLVEFVKDETTGKFKANNIDIKFLG